jgi:hypothetical protein
VTPALPAWPAGATRTAIICVSSAPRRDNAGRGAIAPRVGPHTVCDAGAAGRHQSALSPCTCACEPPSVRRLCQTLRALPHSLTRFLHHTLFITKQSKASPSVAPKITPPNPTKRNYQTKTPKPTEHATQPIALTHPIMEPSVAGIIGSFVQTGCCCTTG